MTMPMLGESIHGPFPKNNLHESLKTQSTRKYSIILLEIISNALPRSDLLQKRNVNGGLSSLWCGQLLETHFHLFLACH